MKEINGIKIFEAVEELNKLDIPDIGFCIVKTDDELFPYEINRNGISIFAGAYNLETALTIAKALKYGVREMCETCKYWDKERSTGNSWGYCMNDYCSSDVRNDFGCIQHEKKAGTP